MDLTLADTIAIPVWAFITYATGATLGRRLRISSKMVRQILLYHTFFCAVYVWYSLNFPADVNRYILWAKNGEFGITPGSDMVVALTALMTEVFGMSRTATFLPFNLIGCVGLLILYSMLRHFWGNASGFTRYLPAIIVFQPGLSFWTSAIGKDGPAFLGACLAVYAFMDINRRYWILLLGISIAFLVRPYFGVMLLLPTVVTFLVASRTSFVTRISLGLVLVGMLAAIVPYTLAYVGLDRAQNVADVALYLETRGTYNQIGGGSVDITSLSLPMKLFTYMFRPLFFDARSLFQLVSSAENLVYLFLLLYYWKTLLREIFRNRQPLFVFSLGLFLFGWLIFAQTTANLGISVRQKTMILPAFLVIVGTCAARRGRRRVLYTTQQPQPLT